MKSALTTEIEACSLVFRIVPRHVVEDGKLHYLPAGNDQSLNRHIELQVEQGVGAVCQRNNRSPDIEDEIDLTRLPLDRQSLVFLILRVRPIAVCCGSKLDAVHR